MRNASKPSENPEVILFQIFSKGKRMEISGLGVNYISSSLNEHGVPTRVLNTRAYCGLSDPEGKILSRLEDFSPRIVGISSISHHHNDLLRLSERIKKRLPDVFLVVGGYGPTFSDDIVASPYIDLVVKGEGERTMKDVADRVLSGVTEFSGVRGVSYVVDDKIVRCPGYDDLENLDSLAFPDKDLIDDSPDERKNIIITSRGCIHRCNFCAIPKFYKGTMWRERSKENVVREIRRTVEKYGITSVEFFDDEFLIRGKRLEEIVSEMDKYPGTNNMPVSFAARSNTLRLNEDLLEKYSARISEIFCGIESFNPRYLEALGKSKSGDGALEDNLRAIEILKSFGIKAKYGFITPPRAKTASFIREHLPLRFPGRVDLVDFVEQVASLDNYELPFDSGTEYLEKSLSPVSRRYIGLMGQHQRTIKTKAKELGDAKLREFFDLALEYSEDGDPRQPDKILELIS